MIPVGGFTASNLSGYGLDAGAGVAAGGYAELGSGYLQFQTGLTYNTYEQEFDAIFIDIKVKEEYLSVPTSMKVNFMGDPTRTVYMKVGAIPSFLTAQKYEYDGIDSGRGNVHGFKPFYVLAAGSVGGSIRAGTGAVVVDGTYIRGLGSALKSSENHGGGGTLSGVIITAGYSFPL